MRARRSRTGRIARSRPRARGREARLASWSRTPDRASPWTRFRTFFRPFYTTKQHSRGAGLGLKVARDVVAAHGGHIEVHALASGGGASFRVVVPRAAPGDRNGDRLASQARPRAASEAEIQIRELDQIFRVLVVDDDPMFPRAIRRGLKPHEVLTASSASEAEMLLLAAGYDADLIVCDISLPGANGDVLHQRIQAKRPDLAARFVFVTGAALGKAEADYLKASGCATLLKPVDAPQLLSPARGARERLERAAAVGSHAGRAARVRASDADPATQRLSAALSAPWLARCRPRRA